MPDQERARWAKLIADYEASDLVTACYPCAFGKGGVHVEELGLSEPRPALRDGWDDLEGLIPALKIQCRKSAAGGLCEFGRRRPLRLPLSSYRRAGR